MILGMLSVPLHAQSITAEVTIDAKNIDVKDSFVEEYVNDLTAADDANLTINIFALPK